MTSYVLLIAYGLIATLFLFVLLRHHSREEDAIGTLKKLLDEIADPVKKSEINIELLKLMREHRPWFERSLSSIGVVGFISMTVAAGISAVQATIQSGNTEALRKEVRALEGQKVVADQIMENATDTILAKQEEDTYLMPFDRHTLEYRLADIDEALLKGADESGERRLSLLRQKYAIHLALNDPQQAIRVFEENMDIGESEFPEDQICLAETFGIKGFEDKALAVLDKVEQDSVQVDPKWEARAFKLRAFLDPNAREDCTRILSAILRIPIDDAKAPVERAIRRYREATHRLSQQKQKNLEEDF